MNSLFAFLSVLLVVCATGLDLEDVIDVIEVAEIVSDDIERNRIEDEGYVEDASTKVAYNLNPDDHRCWDECDHKTGLCNKGSCKGGYCCRTGWEGCDPALDALAVHHKGHTCVRYKLSKKVAYNPDPDDHRCWDECDHITGHCNKGSCKGGYCCRTGWKGCNPELDALAVHNKGHTCVRYKEAYNLDPDDHRCWDECDHKTGLCNKGSCKGGYCCRTGWDGCDPILDALAVHIKGHTCVRYKDSAN